MLSKFRHRLDKLSKRELRIKMFWYITFICAFFSIITYVIKCDMENIQKREIKQHIKDSLNNINTLKNK